MDFHYKSRVVVMARGQFGNPEEGDRPPLEADTRRRVKGLPTEKTQYVP
jgi:hypothetical protein